MHLATVDIHLEQGTVDEFHLLFLAREDDNTFQVAGLEYALDDAQFLVFVTEICALLYLLGRFAHGDLHRHRVFEKSIGQFLYLLRHRGREHDGLTCVRQIARNLLDVVRESHIEHAVGLIEDEERHIAEIGIAHRQMAEEASRSGDYHIGTETETLQFLIVTVAIVATIDGHAAYTVKIIAEALHGLVYLLGEFACGTHDDAVDGVLRAFAILKTAEYR